MMQLWWNISIQWYSMDNGPPNHWCIMMCCFKYNGRIWHLPFSSHEASDVGRVVWRDQGVAGALQLGLQPFGISPAGRRHQTAHGRCKWWDHVGKTCLWASYGLVILVILVYESMCWNLAPRMCTKNALPTRKKEQAPNQRAEVSHLPPPLSFLLKNSQKPPHLLWEGDEKDSLEFWLWIGGYFPT